MLHPSLLAGIQSALSYVVKEMGVAGNLNLLIFLFGFGSFVGLVRVTGGVAGFSDWLSKRIQSTKGAFAITWISSLATFMAPDFRIITVAPVMKSVFSRLHVPAEKVAFIIDATSTPVCAMIPIGTAFIGYMVGLIATSGRHIGLHVAPYGLLLASIPFNFFSIAAILYSLWITFFQRQKAEITDTETNTETETPHPAAIRKQVPPPLALQLAHMETATELAPAVPARSRTKKAPVTANYPDPLEIVADDVSPRARHLIVPLALLLGLTLFLTWWDGHTKSPTFFGALAQANASRAMLEALLITLTVSFIWYLAYRQPLHRIMFGFMSGGNEMMAVNVLLILVWAVSAVSTDLGFSTYVARMIGGIVPAMWIAPALFAFGCIISYVIGSSFGTWGILVPLGFSLAATTHASLALIAGAVFASGTFGGFVSPLSDNTVAMATVMKLPVMAYSRLKLKVGLWLAGACTVGYAAAGWLIHG